MNDNLKNMIDTAYNRGILKHGLHDEAIKSVTVEMEELLCGLAVQKFQKDQDKPGMVYRWRSGFSNTMKKLLDRKSVSE